MSEYDLKKDLNKKNILTTEQDQVLDMYINNLDSYFDSIKASERLQVKIETLHLKKILTK